MIAITPYEATDYGISLPEAAIEVKEINTSTVNSYYQGTKEDGTPEYRNTIVRFRVWVDIDAYRLGKRPIVEGERFVNLAESQQKELSNVALSALFEQAEIVSG